MGRTTEANPLHPSHHKELKTSESFFLRIGFMEIDDV